MQTLVIKGISNSMTTQRVHFLNDEGDVLDFGYIDREVGAIDLSPSEVINLKEQLTEQIDHADKEDKDRYILMLKQFNRGCYEIWTDADGDDAELIWAADTTTLDQSSKQATNDSVDEWGDRDNLETVLSKTPVINCGELLEKKAGLEEELGVLLTESSQLSEQHESLTQQLVDIEVAQSLNKERIADALAQIEALGSELKSSKDTIQQTMASLAQQLEDLQKLMAALS